MKKSRYVAAVCAMTLLCFVAGCDDDDDLVTAVDEAVVAGALDLVLPATAELPLGVAQIFGNLVALAPATSDRGFGCVPVTPIPSNVISCTSGTASYCESGGFVAIDFNRCVDEDGTEIDGSVEATPVARGVIPTVSVAFQPGFTLDGNPITGGFSSLALAVPTAVTFGNLGFSIDGVGATIPSGGLTIASGTDATGSFPLQLDLQGIGALSGTVTLASGVLQTTTLQGLSMQFDCTGSLSAGIECVASDL